MLIIATELIGVMFVVFEAMICVARLLRTSRGVQLLRERRQTYVVESNAQDLRRPADDYHDLTWLPLCTRASETVVRKIGRPLDADERQRIWKARSELVLEILVKECDADAAAGAVLASLKSLPSGLDRPDPTDWCGPHRETEGTTQRQGG